MCNLNLNFVWEDVKVCKGCVRVCKCVCKSVCEGECVKFEFVWEYM